MDRSRNGQFLAKCHNVLNGIVCKALCLGDSAVQSPYLQYLVDSKPRRFQEEIRRKFGNI
jgi:hypothetical protein